MSGSSPNNPSANKDDREVYLAVVNENMMELGKFAGTGYHKGRPTIVQAAWHAVHFLVFQKWWCPNRLRLKLLRVFGAEIGDGVIIRHGVRVHWPWKLSVGPDSWIGEGVHLLNLENIIIGTNVCISQHALICTGSHDYRSPTFEFDNRAIAIGSSSWIATRAIVLRGVNISERTVIGAGVVVKRDTLPGEVLP